MPISTVSERVWLAWQVILNPDGSFTFRQWLKFGIDGDVFPRGALARQRRGREIVGLQYIRDFVTDTTYEDGRAQLGDGSALQRRTDHGRGSRRGLDARPLRLFQAGLGQQRLRVGMTAEATSATRAWRRDDGADAGGIERPARASAPDGTAWGDWNSSGAMDARFSDRTAKVGISPWLLWRPL
jgi:hypothetical protein